MARVRVIRFSVLRVTIWYSQVEKLEPALNRGSCCHAVTSASWAMSSASGSGAIYGELLPAVAAVGGSELAWLVSMD